MIRSILLVILFSSLSIPTLTAYEQTGFASWYGGDFHGKLTANGETFDTYELTAAHKELPFNTIVTVTNLANGKSVQVRINDRGPFVEGRIIDLSYAAASEIGMIESGTAEVIISTDEFEELNIHYYIHLGSYSNLDYAQILMDRLTDDGFTPVACLTNTGITRVIIENIPEDELISVVSRLTSKNYDNLLIKQY